MEVSRSFCRLCLSESEFNVSLFGSFSRRVNLLDKILVCLKLVIEDSDFLNTVCYKCVDNVERYYDYITFIKKCQTKLGSRDIYERQRNDPPGNPMNMRHVTSYVREQVYDADYTFSFLERSNIDEKKETKASSPYFSYFSPPNLIIRQSNEPTAWKTPLSRCEEGPNAKMRREDGPKRHCKTERPRQHSRDLFESQSQDADELDARPFDWKPIPDSNIIKRVREKCFGRSDF